MSNMNKVLGFERINERRQRPNKLINFIKPREGPDKELAQDFLERVAAICYPIMKANHIVVMSLEEYPSNKEFLGRNFNAGEIIQLVLKTPSGHWYPFKHVQMVMMHELAHCKQMNHSREFWKVNNAHRDELKALWARNYYGEGLWGRGQTLLSGRYSNNHMPEAGDAPANLCGGTYRSRGGRKRKRADADKPKISYAERKQRRIAKKFGVNGQALGADEYTRFELDQGRHRPSKPRVAGSKRGRELRAAAALARFDKPKEEPVKEEAVTISDDDYETDSEDGEPSINGDWDDSNEVVKICENEDLKDDEAQRELDELQEIDLQATCDEATKETQVSSSAPTIDLDDEQPGTKKIESQASTLGDGVSRNHYILPRAGLAQDSKVNNARSLPQKEDMSGPNYAGYTSKNFSTNAQATSSANEQSSQAIPQTSPVKTQIKVEEPAPTQAQANQQPIIPVEVIASKSIITAPAQKAVPCEVCSYENDAGAATCTMCTHVMDPNKIPNSWRCTSEACKGSAYRNLGDYGRCYVCQAKRLEDS